MDYSSCVDFKCRIDPASKSKLSLPVYFLVCFFGIGSWLAINGIWMELPILVNHAPEKWTLPSYLTVITELANIGPLLYFISNRIFPTYIHERTTIYALTILGSIAYTLLAFLWHRTSYVFGSERSSALIVLSFFVALVDCTSTVTFLPFMAILPEVYMSALFTGENMSSLLPSFVSLIQGVDKNRNVTNKICTNGTCHNITMTISTGLTFAPKYFFLFLVLMLVTSGAAFVALNHLSLVKKHHVLKYSDLQRTPRGKPSTRQQCMSNEEESEDRAGLLDSNSHLAREHENNSSELSSVASPRACGQMPPVMKINIKIVYLLILQAWINCMSNGVISQIQAFACEPYGVTSYHLGIANNEFHVTFNKQSGIREVCM